jgi:hypothetical protein
MVVPFMARAGYEVHSPYVHAGKTEFKVEGETYRYDPDPIGATYVLKLELKHGFTEFWASEAEVERETRGDERADELKWKNIFQLTPRGRYWADFGVLAEGKFPTESHSPNEVEVGPLAVKTVGRTTIAVNLLLKREIGADASGGTKFDYAARIVYHLSPFFEPALEAYGSPGELGDFLPRREQRHQFGPGFYGEIPVGREAGKIKYSAAALRSLTDAGSARWTYVLKVEYEF